MHIHYCTCSEWCLPPQIQNISTVRLKEKVNALSKKHVLVEGTEEDNSKQINKLLKLLSVISYNNFQCVLILKNPLVLLNMFSCMLICCSNCSLTISLA